ncbi:ATP-dependent RNA helicase DDX42, partial [Armadillidium nasatum]
YFEEDDDANDGAYQPAPGSPGPQINSKTSSSSEEDDDPLDAFMAGIEQEANFSIESEQKGVRQDIDEEDNEESYYRYMEENPNAGKQAEESEDDMEYDEDGNPIPPKKPKYIDPLPPIDHSEFEYEEFTKNFYQEHEEIAALTEDQVRDLREKLGIKISGFDTPKPVSSFGHFGFDDALMKAIRKSEYTQPTPIQAQAVPIALSGRDIIGIAKTGSGKTAAFIWPLLVHIMDQKELSPGEGPVGLILAPTRELAQQIYTEAKRFGKAYNIQVVCAYGGGSKWEQSKALEAGAEIVVATPGRMIDMIKMKATNFQRVTFLILDEADRMFDMGFEPQVRSICDHVRPDRQTLLFSATFKKKVEKLARDVLTDPIRVIQGELGEANQDITQTVQVFSVATHKWNWLLAHLVEFMSAGSVLIFVTKKLNAEELSTNLQTKEFDVLLLHGDMTQFERNEVITAFKKKESPVLVATDVAARGRAGEKGVAYTLVSDKDKEFAGHLVRNLEGANQEVSPELMELAMQSSWFRKSRFKSGKAKALGGRGLGYRERPGLGAPTTDESKDKNSTTKKGYYGIGPASQAYGASSDPANIGPASNRLAAMKAAFHSQYKSQFITAERSVPWSSEMVHTSDIVHPPKSGKDFVEPQAPPPPVSQTPPPRKRKKSRWED